MELVDVMSDVSADSEDEQHMMDPSDPRAHGRSDLRAKSNPIVEGQRASRWDSDEEDDNEEEEEEEVDEDLGVPIQVDEDNEAGQEGEEGEAQSSDVALKLKARLSSWAASRFLVPRSERQLPVMEELPIEPLNDFILSDFGTRFRGTTGDVPVEKAVALDDDAPSESETMDDKFTVGAPLFSTTSSSSTPLLKDDNKKSTDTNENARNKPRRETRYFITDLATKCFNCGQVGHMASVCANDKLERACYYCALRGHPSFACPHLPCSACLRLGHEFKDCPNRRVQRGQSCSLCGRAGHTAVDGCANASTGLSQTTCMVCLHPGHLSCTPFPPPADRRVYCPHCAGNHALARCTAYVAPAATSFSARLPRTDMKCFVCNIAGHIAAECPKRTGYNGGNSCFNCGERGHYASDCTRSSTLRGGGGGGNTSKNGRKRGRNEYYADDYYDEEEEEEEEYRYGASRGGGGGGRKQHNRTNSSGSTRYRSVAYDGEDESAAEEQYYYVPNGNNRRGGARGGSGGGGGGGYKKPRVDAALTSYRHNNSNGGGGYNKGNRRRWN